MRGLTKFLTVLAICLSFSSTAIAQDSRTGDYYDPLEPLNRAVFSFNNYVDIFILDPLTVGYRYVTVPEARSAVQNFLRNLREPLNILNNLLQGDLGGAYKSTFRVVVNSFAGFGGILDVAGWEGYEYENEDFGQTLAKWGVSDGPYLVLPLMGPSSTRDHAANMVEGYADPFNHWAFNTDQEEYFYARLVGEVLTAKDNFMDIQQDLRLNSVDYYAAVRSVLYQRSQAALYDNDPNAITAPAIPDYDDF